MGNAQGSARASGPDADDAVETTTILVIVGFIALIVAAKLMFDRFDRYASFEAEQNAAAAPAYSARDARNLQLLNEILAEQSAARRELVELRSELAARAERAPPTQGDRSRPCPAACNRPDAGPSLDRIARYLAAIDSTARSLVPQQ